MNHQNKAITRLSQLQSFIKRDSESYYDDFKVQLERFRSELSIFLLNPSQERDSFLDLVKFTTSVAQFYPTVYLFLTYL